MKFTLFFLGIIVLRSGAEIFQFPGEGKWNEKKCLRYNISEVLKAFGLMKSPEEYFPKNVSSYQDIKKYTDYVTVSGLDPYGDNFERKFEFEKARTNQGMFRPFRNLSEYVIVAEKHRLMIETFNTGKGLEVSRQFTFKTNCMLFKVCYREVFKNISGCFFYTQKAFCKEKCKTFNALN